MSSNEVEVEALYAKRAKIHAREVKGFFANLRKTAVIVLLGIYYLAPWLRWGTRQAILFDLPARQFHILGLTLWPQDFVFLSWLLIMAALLLFFATTVAGRVWCGYVCPQTVWTEIFVWMERLTEGNFNQRIKLDKAPWSPEKILRKSAKQILWISFAAWTGFTFVGYFTPIRELGVSLLSFDLGGWETFWICFYSLATYGNAGALREQVCIYMCPYARFQSAMFDRDTLIVSYDPARGEPRGGRQRGTSAAANKLGDCIDCRMCVQACPTGIDIRKGLQYECITCAACIDACDVVMDKVGYPRGLIRYTTQNAVQGKPQHILRPRVILYGTILLLLFAGFVITLANRAAVRLDVIRDRNTLYRELPDGQIENVYQLKILNKEDHPRSVRVSVTGLPGAQIETAPAEIDLAPGALLDVVARISVERSAAPQGRADLNIRVEDAVDGTVQAQRDARFFGPPAMTAKPWYRHFWVWFILTPVIGSVIAGFVTLYLAGAPPSLVVDDFGQIAMAVELDQQRDRRAVELGVAARLQFDAPSGDSARAVTVSLSGAAPDSLRLELIHPTLEQMDRHVILKRRGNLYAGTMPRADTRLYVMISDAAGNWRLTGVLEPRQEVLELKAGR